MDIALRVKVTLGLSPLMKNTPPRTTLASFILKFICTPNIISFFIKLTNIFFLFYTFFAKETIFLLMIELFFFRRIPLFLKNCILEELGNKINLENLGKFGRICELRLQEIRR